MSILSALKQQHSSIDDLAKLPQAMIMQMAQKKQISEDMLAPILSRKAEMMDAVARSKSLQQPAGQPSVMEQVMAKNIQAENPANAVPAQPQAMPQAAPQAMPQAPEEAGVAQLPIPERQYAGGGIVAFAKGDLIDLDEDEDESDILAEYAQAMAEGERAIARNADMPAGKMPTENAGVGLRYTEPMPKGASKGINFTGGKHPYESLVAAKAEEYGVDPRLASYILNKETGGLKNPENARSSAGAMGIAQFMPATAKQYGINPDIPEEAAIGMGKHLRYLMNKYDDPKLAAIAYNWGEGNTNKWLKAGADMDKLPKETRKYVAQLAGGGEVRHFANEGYVDPMGGYGGDYSERDTTFDPFQEALASYKKQALQRKETEKSLKGTNLDVPAVKVPAKEVIPQAGLTPEEMAAGSTRAGTFEAMTKDTTTGRELPSTKVETPQSYWDKVMGQMEEDRSSLANQRAEDKNMALLAAGLGMLGGSSQYAFENIGKGGLSGVQYLSEANKQRAAEKAALDKNMLVAQRYKELGETSKGNQAGLLALRGAELNRKVIEDKMEAIGRLEKNSLAKATAALRTQGILGVDNFNDPQIQRQLNEWVQNDLANNKAYNKLYQEAFGFAYDVAPKTTGDSGVIKLDKKGNPIK